MGLDITAYKNLRQLNEDEIEYEEYKDENDIVVERYPLNGKKLYLNPNYPHAAPDISSDLIYGYESKEGWRAGSYSGYNQWRSWLATVAGWDDAEHALECGDLGDPFFEMINFSDCEGTLGTTTCQKLLQDFIKFQDKVDSLPEDHTYQKNLYAEWRKGFEMAADNGAIEFH